MNNMNVRWAFNIAKWTPTQKELLLATACIQPEEKERIARFVFKKDFMSSLIGRLMMRKYVNESTHFSYKAIRFVRDDKGKPVLTVPNDSKLSFNVSHQGDYAVFAGLNNNIRLGVDVMKLEYSGGKNLNDFFRLMTKHFSPSEWTNIKSCDTERRQIEMFCRHWCLKESYVKAIGVGITVNLQEISFKINTKELSKFNVVTDTELFFKGLKQDWEFQEMLLDEDHCCSVALDNVGTEKVVFKCLDVWDLVRQAELLLNEDEGYCLSFFKKLEKS